MCNAPLSVDRGCCLRLRIVSVCHSVCQATHLRAICISAGAPSSSRVPTRSSRRLLLPAAAVRRQRQPRSRTSRCRRPCTRPRSTTSSASRAGLDPCTAGSSQPTPRRLHSRWRRCARRELGELTGASATQLYVVATAVMVFDPRADEEFLCVCCLCACCLAQCLDRTENSVLLLGACTIFQL